ncbi:MAG: hypothetical protein HW421_3440 [Ignavibacteria bacterium]|nr:hypothetical protein [Ignavibacteria bacterium]
MEKEIIEYFLPSELLKYFTITNVLEKEESKTKEKEKSL